MILWLALLLADGVTAVDVGTRPPSAAQMRKARDPNIAVREELDAARAKRTLAAYDLFIARHPDHPLALVARKERAKLAGTPDRAE